MRFPRTLSGQLILVMLLAVALSQAVTLVIYRIERARTVRTVVGEECLGRAVSAYRLAEAIPPERRAATLEASETPLTRYWITDRLLPAAQWQDAAREHLMKPISATGEHSRQTSLFLNEPMLDHRRSDADWEALPAGTWLLQRPVHVLDLSRWNGFGFSMQLDEDSWLNMAYAKPDSFLPTALTPGYYTALAITLAIVAGAALLVARRISRPLRRLTRSVESLGRGEELALLPEEGPADIRATVAAFNRMQIRLRRFLEDRTRMLAAISHDLRTPITSLRLRAEFIADEETREKIASGLDELKEMAEAALSFAQSEAETEPTRVVEMNALLQSLCDDLADLGWDVKFQSAGRLPYPCRPAALRRAVRNVIENAVRYGGRAEVSLIVSPDAVSIVVEDGGPGIPEEDQERVFDPFVRLEASRNRETGGVGLGLSIARSILRGHGGDIEFGRGRGGFQVRLDLPHAPTRP